MFNNIILFLHINWLKTGWILTVELSIKMHKMHFYPLNVYYVNDFA